MAKKNENNGKIPVEELKVDGVYKTYVGDIVKILKINNERKEIVLSNVTGAHKQWTSFKNIYIVEQLY